MRFERCRGISGFESKAAAALERSFVARRSSVKGQKCQYELRPQIHQQRQLQSGKLTEHQARVEHLCVSTDLCCRARAIDTWDSLSQTEWSKFMRRRLPSLNCGTLKTELSSFKWMTFWVTKTHPRTRWKWVSLWQLWNLMFHLGKTAHEFGSDIEVVYHDSQMWCSISFLQRTIV
jgi:hypothetical protein